MFMLLLMLMLMLMLMYLLMHPLRGFGIPISGLDNYIAIL